MLSATGFGMKRESDHAVLERPLITPKTPQPVSSGGLVGPSSSSGYQHGAKVGGRAVERARSLRVLVVDDDPSVRSACCEIAAKMGYEVTSAGDVPEARVLLKRQIIDILLMDLKLPGEGGLSLLEEVKSLYSDTSVVVMTAFATVDSAVEVMQNGAGNYLSKPFALERLTSMLEEAGASRRVSLENRRIKERLRTEKGMGDLIGRSPEMEKLYRMMSKVFGSTHPVLILGESGTGKELVARSIHKNGPNALKPFVPVDCRALLPTLMESEIFGHVKGAFAGANRDKTGLLVAAEGGTVFLDEVGELPMDLQAKLLRALQEKEVRPAGATKAVPIQTRILAATDRNLIAMVEQGKFRKDLYYRLNVVTLKVPSLRERRADIPMMAEHFLEQQKIDPGKKFLFSEEVMHLLVAYDWPGNVRELAHAVEHLCKISSGPMLETSDTPSPIRAFGIQAQAGARIAVLSGDNPPETQAGSTLSMRPAGVVSIADMERNAILVTIQQLKGDKLMAAKLLGIGKTTLYRKLKEYGISE
jgi:DNA-binding NtrC family response regulator